MLGINGNIHQPHPYFLKYFQGFHYYFTYFLKTYRAGINAISFVGIHKKNIINSATGSTDLSKFFK